MVDADLWLRKATAWAWTALDAETGFVPSWLVAAGTDAVAGAFAADLSSRTGGRIVACDGSPIGSVPSEFPTVFSEAVERIDEPWLADLSEGFAKKVRRHEAALTLLFTIQNFAASDATRTFSPAMAIGISDRVWTVADFADLLM